MSATTQHRSFSAPGYTSVSDKPYAAHTSEARIGWQRLVLYAALALGFFLLGSVPMWLRGQQHAIERETAQHELRLSEMENRLSAAVIDASQGEYELARQRASDFFSSLQNQIDRGPDSDLTTGQRESMAPIIAQRDEIIALLARNDPAAANRLGNIYVDYRKSLKQMSRINS